MATSLTLTRASAAALTGGRALLFDCLVCPKGVYVGVHTASAACSCCGASMPETLRRWALANARPRA